MEDYYEHKCSKMNEDEEIRDYGDGWEIYILDSPAGIDFIHFCPTCGTNLEYECIQRLKEKYPDAYGKI